MFGMYDVSCMRVGFWMVDENPYDPVSEIRGNIEQLDEERAVYVRMAAYSEFARGDLSSSAAIGLLTGYLRFFGETRPEVTAANLLDRFQSLADVFNAPLSLLRKAGLGNERALGAIMQYRAIREALAIEKTKSRSGSFNPTNLTPYLLKLPHPSTKPLRILFLNKRAALLHESWSDQPTDWQSHTLREICQTALHHDASGLVIAYYTRGENLVVEDKLLAFSDELRNAARLIEIIIHDIVIVGPASVHSLSNLKTI